jgi:3-oxoacyl-[acyl-carrier protein] reductase
MDQQRNQEHPMKELENKVALVTGASKGIGAGIATSFGRAGAAVAVNYASSREGADRVVAAIVAAGGKAFAVQGDVANPDDVRRIHAAVREAYGRLDVLVNNAGVYQFDPLENIAEAEFHRQFNTNVLGTLLATQEAVKLFGANGGSVINVSSVVSRNPPPGSAVYSGTKGAVDAITITLARELAPRKIRVNAIAPGATMSEGFEAAGIAGSEFEKQMVARTPLGRLGQADDIARLAVFLASDQAGWLTGELIAASGGFH